MSFGTDAQIISANRFKIDRAGTEITLTSDVKVRQIRTVDRLETRAGPIDTYRWLLQELEFEAALTDLLLAQLETDNNINSFQNLPSATWNVVGVAINGVGADDTAQAFTARLIDFEELGPENGVTKVRVKLRVAAAAT
jgi:hypothetical protein